MNIALPMNKPSRIQFLLILGIGIRLAAAGDTWGQDSSLLHQVPGHAARPSSSQANRTGPASYSPTSSSQPGVVDPRQGVYQDGSPVPRYPGPNAATAPQATALREVSWMYTPAVPARQYRLHDIITIRVDEIAQASAEGSAENRKNSLYDAILKDWISLSGGDLKPAPQSDGDPRINGQLNSLYRADASIESRESLTFNIAATIVDIRPNGNLVVEAHKTIWVNDNAFETSLTGTCRAVDIGPDNVLLSRDLLNPQIRKAERGRLRDGYRRGWFQRWFEEFQPF